MSRLVLARFRTHHATHCTLTRLRICTVASDFFTRISLNTFVGKTPVYNVSGLRLDAWQRALSSHIVKASKSHKPPNHQDAHLG